MNHPLLYAGLNDHTGYAVAARRAANALQVSGTPHQWCTLSYQQHGSKSGWFANDRDGDTRSDILIGHTPPDQTLGYRGQIAHQKFVNHTVWETDEIPAAWVSILNDRTLRVHSVVVPTEWNAETFRRGGVRIPIHVVPHATLEPTEVIGGALPIDIAPDAFVFSTVTVWETRKAPERVIEAYLRAFTADDPVMLIVKTGSTVPTWDPSFRAGVTAATWWRVADVVRRFRSPAPIMLVSDKWTESQISALNSRTDCAVSLPSGEGWGLPIFDAACSGKPVITTGWGGPLAYLGSHYAGLVDVRLVQANIADTSLSGHWAEPDLEHATSLFRDVVSNHAAWKEQAQHVGSLARASCSPERVAHLLKKALQ